MTAGLHAAQQLKRRFATPFRAPSYRPLVRRATMLVVLLLIASASKVLVTHPLDPMIVLLLAAASVIVALGAWFIITGTTTVDDRGIRQQWIVERRFDWDEIVRARFLKVPLLPRLVVSTGRGPIKVLSSGCPELDTVFGEIDNAYRGTA